MTLALQSFLRSGGTPEDLLTRYAIKAKPHPRYPSLRLFVYDQISSDPREPIVQEARGIILDSANDWAVASYAFRKFGNHGEAWADEIDWSTARVQEKVDGSLAVLYPHDGAWHVATKGTPDAGGDVNGHGITFRDYFWQTFAIYGDALPAVTDRRCFFFELSGPMNRVVVQHAKPHLTLLGARNLDTLQEIPVSEVRDVFPSIPRVKEFPLTSVAEIEASFAHINPLSQEGYVVVDAQFRRQKIKSPAYVALHRLVGGLSRRRLLEIVRMGESSEVLVAFPEYHAMLEDVRRDYEALIAECEADYAKHSGIAVQKDFALAIKGVRCPSALFVVRAKKAESFRAHFADCNINHLLDLLGYRSGEEPLVREAA